MQPAAPLGGFESVVRHSKRAVFRRMAAGEGAVVLQLDSLNYHSLNETGAAIWESIGSGEARIFEVVERLRTRFPDAPEGIGSDVFDFLCGLADRGLVDLHFES